MNIRSSPIVIEFLGTPEAGKTTVINGLKEQLDSTYNVSIVRETAEILPTAIPKGSIHAHFWMRLTMAQHLLEKEFSTNGDIILVDRGIIDTIFWNYYWGEKGSLSEAQVEYSNNFFRNIGISTPNLVVALTVNPETAILRRGEEGRIVTKPFIKDFNTILANFLKKQSDIETYVLDTSKMSVSTVRHRVYKQISSLL